jgi:hypothetical protein
MYWTSHGQNGIWRANLDGSNVEMVVDGGLFGFALVLEPVPEPHTIVLLFAAGLVMLVKTLRRNGARKVAST